MSKTKTVTGNGDYGETYTLTYTGIDNLNVTGSTFTITSLFPTTMQAKITGMSGTYIQASVDTTLKIDTNGSYYANWQEYSLTTVPPQKPGIRYFL